MALTRHLTTQELVRSGPISQNPDGSGEGKPWGALAAVCLATFVVLADFMAIGVALPSVQKGLGMSFGELQWTVEAFVVPLAVGVLAAGYAAGRFGRRPVFLAGLAILACGSLVAALAPSAYFLIGARAVQGVGGAMLLATSAVILAEVFREAHGRVSVAVWGVVTGLALGVSPAVGSAIDTWLGWRWIFGLAAAASSLAFVLGHRTVRFAVLDTKARSGSDWRGLALFTASTAILVIGLVRTTTTLGGWAQSGVLACFACSGLLLASFVAVEAISPHPLLDVSLFRRRTFAASAVAAFGLSMAIFGPFIFLVLFLSYNLGYSTLSIGGHLLLLSGMTLALLPLAGALDRYVPVKLIIFAGLALVGAGLWLMSRLPVNASWQDLVPGLVVAGVGLELVNPRLASTAAAAAPAEERAAVAASRANTTMRQLGTATGVAVLGSVFATRLTDEISSRVSALSQLSGQGPQLAGFVLEGRTAAAVDAAPAAARPFLFSAVQASFTTAMHEVFLIASAVALVSGLLALSIRSRDVPRQKRALEEVEVVPTVAALSAAENVRAQLVPGPVARGEARPANVVLPAVVHAEVVHAEVAPGDTGPVERAPAERAPAERAPAERAPAEGSPEELGPSELSSVEAFPPGLATVKVPPSRASEETLNWPSAMEADTARLRDLGAAGQLSPSEVPEVVEPDEPHGLVPAGALQSQRPPLTRGEDGAGTGRADTGSLAVRVTRASDRQPLKAELTIVGTGAEVVARYWTGTDGELILPLTGGNYEVVVQKLGYRPETMPVVVTDGSSQTVDLVLTGIAHIYGAVEGPGGGWLPGVLLTLTDPSGRVVASTKTDAAGSYHFPRVPEGSYTVTAPAYFGATSQVEIGPGSAVAADVTFGSHQDENWVDGPTPASEGPPEAGFQEPREASFQEKEGG
jgi:MFS family permease